jgi:uncharacterized protein DUF6283
MNDESTKGPLPRPCGSCPYRRDVPSGVWHTEEYLKLIPYDRPIHEQPQGVFACHQQDGHLCAGWVGTHDMSENLALRFHVSGGHITAEEFFEICDYTTDVPLFESGLEAATHGLNAIVNGYDEETEHKVDVIQSRLKKKGLVQSAPSSERLDRD